ncbi:hypothetical protein D3C86_1924590 [compost metagenome]
MFRSNQPSRQMWPYQADKSDSAADRNTRRCQTNRCRKQPELLFVHRSSKAGSRLLA